MGLFGIRKQQSCAPGQPGQFGAYCLQELINSGGMADIWLATNASKEVCAIKRLHHNLRSDVLSKKRFVSGCEALARMQNHEFIIGYIDHGKVNGDLFLAMEYVEASNLKQLLTRADPVLTENVAAILIDMAVGLEHVHDCGYLHLDFKPENVLVTRNARLRLVDFDLSQPRSDKPRKTTGNPGTPSYMAPEQLLRRPIDHRADIFAFGVTAYELLTGRKPFPGETPKEVLKQQLEDRSTSFVPLRNVNPDVPFLLEKAIVKCLDSDPEKRYPHMSVLVRDLESALYV